MDRRHFFHLLLGTLAVPYAEDEPKPAPLPIPETTSPEESRCGVCGNPDYVWDHWLDMHICPKCGAHETTKGWQAR